MQSKDNLVVKSAGVEINLAPMFELFKYYGSPKEVADSVEDFVDSVLPFIREPLENGSASEILYSLDYMNQIKRTLRKMQPV